MLVGFSGTGKTERVVRPLLSRAQTELGAPTAHIDVPARPTQLDEEMLARLVVALRENEASELADAAAAAPSFIEGVRLVLRRGGLIVVDEFQRLLRADRAAPIAPYMDKLQNLATRPADGGCLWLVSNRNPDPEWTESFHSALLEPPGETTDAIDIIIEALGTADASDRLPPDRHEEIARRFGRNPRALRLLGHLMRTYSLEELIGAPQETDDGLSLEDFAERIERSLLVRAREGLSNAAADFLRDLSVLPEPAPTSLLEALGAHLGSVQQLLAELQERFLVEQHRALREVHPLVREVELPRLTRDQAASAAAHRRAGDWYAKTLRRAVDRGDDAVITTALGGLRHHYVAAGAQAEMAATLDLARSYVERKFHWTVPLPSTPEERDAQIALLAFFLDSPGTPSMEFQLARRLELRGEDDDLARALEHSARATQGQDFSDPWVLRLKLAARVHGREAAIALGPEAVAAVDPGKSLYSVYQAYSAALNQLGRAEDAIALLRRGIEVNGIVAGDKGRLLDAAIRYAAAMPNEGELAAVHGWANQLGGCDPQVALAEVLIDERTGAWESSASRARIARSRHSNYLHLLMHEALGWLAVGKPDEAQAALDRFPSHLRYETRTGLTWIAAFIALRTGDMARGHVLAQKYLNGPLPEDRAKIERALIREWDTRLGIMGEHNPSLEFPILPPALTGLPEAVIRPQYGSPVLPPLMQGPENEEADASTKTRILAVGTEWASGQGGLSTFNRQLCITLARSGVDVTCLVITAGPDDIADAEALGVRLVAARPSPGEDERHWLSRRPPDLAPDYQPTVIIGHGRITGPAAARLAEDVFPGVQRLHFIHMAPDEIEWHKFDRKPLQGAPSSAAVLAEQRTQVELDLAKGATRAVAVGPRLHNRFTRDLSPYSCPAPLRFDPGFDPGSGDDRSPPAGAPWKILLLGRAEDEKLKGLDIAAAAVGRVAARLREKGLPEIELVVRGAQPETADALRGKIRAWADAPIDVTIRPYTTDTITLQNDIGSASLVLMPSRSEGFGLVGVEAIIAAAPVLLTTRSGLAEMLRERLQPEDAARITVRSTGDELSADIDSDEWARAIETILADRDAAFRNASRLQKHLGARVSWANSVERLLEGLVDP